MDGCATEKLRFETPVKLLLEAAFDGGRLPSDGGLTWLAGMDNELGMCKAVGEHILEWRTRRGRYKTSEHKVGPPPR